MKKHEKLKKLNQSLNTGDNENRIFKFIALALSLLFFLAIMSHSRNDYTIISGGKSGHIDNWIGYIGAYVSQFMFFMFGLGAYFLSIYLVIRAAYLFIIKDKTKKRGLILSVISFMIGICMLLAMDPMTFRSLNIHIGLGKNMDAFPGGVFGQFLASPQTTLLDPGIVRKYMGTGGTVVLSILLIMLGTISIWKSETLIFLKKLFKIKAKDQIDTASDIPKTKESDTKSISKLEDTRRDIEIKRQMEREAKIEAERTNHVIDDLEDEPPILLPEKKESNEVNKITTVLPQQKTRVLVENKPLKARTTAYKIPPITLLNEIKETSGDSDDAIQKSKEVLQDTLKSFDVAAKVTGAVTGPRITRLEISPSPGVKLTQITGLESNIKLDLKAESIRILAPIPGKDLVGIEIPNRISSPVSLYGLISSGVWKKSSAELPICLGKSVSGEPIITDLARAPHLLIAGSTGSGKSVCINTLIISLLYRFSPDDLRLILVDPKVVEFEMYKTLPHLITPIVNDPRKVPLALRWAINEMERRYKVLARVRIKNIEGFNSRQSDEQILDEDGKIIPKKLPYIVIVIDELADIMMVAKADVETSICRIAQKARAVGIHLVLATQSPRKEIITGVIKANLPTRIAFRVSSMIDSRVILDQNGAESLLGRGDMLFVPPGSAKLERIQGAMLGDDEIEKVVSICAAQCPQNFDDKVVSEEQAQGEANNSSGQGSSGNEEVDNSEEGLIQRAIEVIKYDRKASISYIQRKLGVGYNKAANIMETLEKRGVVGPKIQGKDNREIYLDED